MMKKQSFEKIITIVLAVIVILQCVPLACFADTHVTDVTGDDICDTLESYETDESISFYEYANQFEASYPDDSIIVTETSTELFSGESFKADFVANQAGFYALKLSYSVINSDGQYPVISIKINGNIPYTEASSLNLMRKWENSYDGAEPLTDTMLPEQNELYDVQTCYIRDTVKYYGDILYFHIEEGINSIQIDMDSEDILIKGLVFENPKNAENYSNVKDGYSFSEYQGSTIYIEGEDALYQSDASLYPYNDPSSAAISPSSPYTKYLNVIGGTNWSYVGQYLEWKITVPEDGLYKLGIKYRQNTNYALNSIRTITIDGNLPFDECETVSFPYSASYKNYTVCAGGEEVWFQLSKGEHTFRMEVSIGSMNTILTEVEDIVSQLNDAYRKVIMITGTNPDSLRDYQLETSIPQTLQQLDDLRLRLNDVMTELDELNGGASSGTKTMEKLCKQLSDFAKDSAKITSYFGDFKSNISSLGNWLVDAKKQPLVIDYLYLYGEDSSIKKATASFWDSFKYQFRSFLYTFSDAYLNVSEEETITVWMSAGSSQHRILKQLVESSFNNQDNGTNVDLKLVTSSLLSAIISGKEPNVAIDLAAGDIMNFAFRKAGVDLSGFEDFDEVTDRFRSSMLVPVTFNEKTYALPQTQTYEVLFYRQDILDELDIKIPETWVDVISAMAALKKKNLEFGIPLGTSTYTTLLFQRGKSFYNEDLTATAVTEYESLEAFKMCCSWFTEYKSPISYDGLQRFRTGEMPLLIAGFEMYNNIDILAPEIKGLWGMTMIPGTVVEDGTLNRSVYISGTYSAILKEENSKASWEFLKWWTCEETQLLYAQRVERTLGQSGRYNTANLAAFSQLGYKDKVLNTLNQQGEQGVAVPAVPGSYYLDRYLVNAMNKALYQDEDPADALIGFAKIIDSEIAYKRAEFGLTD